MKNKWNNDRLYIKYMLEMSRKTINLIKWNNIGSCTFSTFFKFWILQTAVFSFYIDLFANFFSFPYFNYPHYLLTRCYSLYFNFPWKLMESIKSMVRKSALELLVKSTQPSISVTKNLHSKLKNQHLKIHNSIMNQKFYKY